MTEEKDWILYQSYYRNVAVYQLPIPVQLELPFGKPLNKPTHESNLEEWDPQF